MRPYKTKDSGKYCVIRTRSFYGPDYKYSLVASDPESDKVIFSSRQEAEAALEAEEEFNTRAYGCYECSHNESGSPSYQIVSIRHPRAARLFRELRDSLSL